MHAIASTAVATTWPSRLVMSRALPAGRGGVRGVLGRVNFPFTGCAMLDLAGGSPRSNGQTGLRPMLYSEENNEEMIVRGSIASGSIVRGSREGLVVSPPRPATIMRIARQVAFALLAVLALAVPPARAAVFDNNDTARLAGVSEAIQKFEDEVSAALHDLPQSDAEQIEAYSYVELNLEAAHERLNTVFMLVAVSAYMESQSDQLLILHVMYGQLLLQSRNYLSEKDRAIASMAAAHPDNKVFAAYGARSSEILRDHAMPLLDELRRRIGELPRPDHP